ncbi:MAG: hypothetical protein K5897_10905 [Eubacterium sp.]|nr:hypothetical protein [Eubacterium sp.]
MKNVVLNERMNLTIPDGFKDLSRAEVQEMTVCRGQAPMWNILNEEDHVLISASWVKSGWLASKLLNAKDMINSILKRTKATANEHPELGYTFSKVEEITLAGKKAYTYTCTYTSSTKEGEKVDMIGEALVVKVENTFYIFQSCYREALKDQGVKELHEVYDSVRF